MNGYRSPITKLFLFLTLCSLLLMSAGCEAFVRKFTRKPKQEKMRKEEMVLAPEEYQSPQMSKEELYRQYFTFWQSWQGELIESLSGNSVNKKKQLSCVKEALKNLEQLMALLDEKKQKVLDGYLVQERALGESLENDIYGNAMASQRSAAERLLRRISREFSYQKIKDSLR